MNKNLLTDVPFNMLVVFLLLLVILIRMLNPPTEDAKAEPPGNLAVSIVWPPSDTDIDLWLTGPGEPRPVGYSHRGGLLWNLLRDDLGTVPDVTGANFETAYTRGAPVGEYTANVHCYRCKTLLPIPVQVEVAISTGDNTSMRVLFTATVTLVKNGQEKTAVRFYLTADGTVKPGSLNAVFRPLRSAKK